ncbi:hypothetical protein RND71_039434 [Anisodus tanguticus]|uniref:Uncharacterized protein n=1 Tax=Anisodus tanguticus TaxID=243964 RepID=A0AAE1QWL3_9SOLA|nr:hypothetical protein RND71_039434 [Anisodus tanguticus]
MGVPIPNQSSVGGLLELHPRQERVTTCQLGDGLGTISSGLSPGVEQPTQNWYAQKEFDCLIKTKHCDRPNGCLCNVISAQCSECQSEEI